MQDLEGRVAVITGAAGGLGRGMALAFAQEGMRLVLADIDSSTLEMTFAELRDRGVEIVAVPTDVTDPDSVNALANAALNEFGAVHVLCNNAGVSTLGYAWETKLADWKWLLDVNLWGVIHGIVTFVPALLNQPEGGHVVNTASTAGLMGPALMGPYVASKHAVVGISKVLRKELEMRGANVGVSVICPGPVRTGMSGRINSRPGRQVDEEGVRPEVTAMLAALRTGDEARMDPETAGRIIVEAVREGRFWVLPNADEHVSLARQEFDELFDTISPVD